MEEERKRKDGIKIGKRRRGRNGGLFLFELQIFIINKEVKLQSEKQTADNTLVLLVEDFVFIPELYIFPSGVRSEDCYMPTLKI